MGREPESSEFYLSLEAVLKFTVVAVENHSVGLFSAQIPKCQGVTSTAFLIPFSSGASLGFDRGHVKNQLDCSRSVRERRSDIPFGLH